MTAEQRIDTENKIRSYIVGYQELPDSISQADNLTAEISNRINRESAKRNSTSSCIGNWGSNEFYWKSGGVYETFEGGHLIPHKYFESDQGEAANYPSIMVPMSRTMNIGINNTWKDIENNLESYLQRSHDQKCTISINITRPEWNLYSEVLEKMLFDNFELTDDNKSESIGTSIIPEKINVSVSYFNGEELSLFPFSKFSILYAIFATI